MTETAPGQPIDVSDSAWKALEGAYDLQIHVGPDVIARRIDDIDCAKEFLAHGMRGFVLKSHYVQTGERAQVVTKAVPGHQGVRRHDAQSQRRAGFNPVAVELAGRIGLQDRLDADRRRGERNRRAARRRHRQAAVLGQDPARAGRRRHLAAAAVRRSTRPARVVEPARGCLERIAKHNMILATGHLGRREIFALVRAAKDMGVKKVLVTHAEFPSQNLTGDEQKELADLGAIIEHCFTTTYTDKATWETAFANIRHDGRVAHAHLDRPRPDHQPAGRRRVRACSRSAAGRRVLRRRRPHDGGDESRRGWSRSEPDRVSGRASGDSRIKPAIT